MAARKKDETLGTRGPPPDSALAALRALGPDWRAKAALGLELLLEEMVRRRAELDAIELLSAFRTVAEALTQNQALVAPDDDGQAPKSTFAPAPPKRLDA